MSALPGKKAADMPSQAFAGGICMQIRYLQNGNLITGADSWYEIHRDKHPFLWKIS